ncbi:TRAP-type C4-dicarboxylate transport system, substrate-binding protein [Desulfonispora thiosulfatigenes DSM 11270]|uniref:TRAP-type C4-dicarboxylate transport system, substrate-binding protein n=1 Tax=Desulfonispora thiosulfatigenes DSM 11270 TaxID=656914 RepID=A0A1W1UVE5_DESTI|nr:TRAP transporter substrate-binding protein DctP [Desulfonispora thiosulfatigenes]SMB85138.1 TRAP-type C4-dicarboxylate transport system, substrate-binding protein [Desulfonispora thiosulfatigenes DSM 11270]
MKKYSKLILALLLVFSLVLFAGCSQSPKTAEQGKADGDKNPKDGPPAEVTKWVMQPCFDSSDAGWGSGVVPWVKAVEEATQGSVKIELLPGGSITSSDEAFSATAAGMIDVYAGWATVYGGEMPEGMLAYGMAMGADTPEEAWEAMWGDKYRIGDIVQKAAHERNVHWGGWTSQGPNAAFTKFPVQKWEDYKGHKMRAGGPQAIFYEAMDGVPVALPGSEIYMSIRLGTIEGTLWDVSGASDMKYHEVVDYAILPGWCPQQHQETFINLDKWNALTDWQREQIEGVFKSTYFETSQMHAEGVQKSLDTLVESGGEIITLSDEEVARMRARCIEKVWPKTAEKSEAAAKGVEIWTQFLKDKGKI